MSLSSESKKRKGFTPLYGVRIDDFRMVVHVTMTNICLTKSVGTFICEGMPLHQLQFICEESVRRSKASFGKFSELKSLFFLNEKNSPEFNTLEELIRFYHKK